MTDYGDENLATKYYKQKYNGVLTNSDTAFQSRDHKILIQDRTVLSIQVHVRTYDTRTNFL